MMDIWTFCAAIVLLQSTSVDTTEVTYNCTYKHGPADYNEYDPYMDMVRVDYSTSISFQTKGANDAQVLVQKNRTDLQHNVIELLFGGWSNSKSEIRPRLDDKWIAKASVTTNGILSSSQYRWFWISWDNGILKVGKGSVVGEELFMSWNGLNHPITAIRVRYGYHSSGSFKFEKSTCSSIEHCEKSSCTVNSYPNGTCDRCIDDNIVYKRTHSDQRCELMCSYNQTKCWPGSCVDGLAKNCQCDSNFNRTGAMCKLQHDARPKILTCQTTIYSMSGDSKQTPGGRTCSDLKDLYGNFQPARLKFDMTSEFNITTISPAKYSYITESKFGVTDTTVRIKKKPVAGIEISLSDHEQKIDNGSSLNVEEKVYSTKVNVPLNDSKYKLDDGERLCIHYEANGGGYVIGYDLTYKSNKTAEPYDKTTATKVICYRYDGTPPKHCLLNKTCVSNLSEPLQISQRIIRQPIIQVGFEGWFEPIPLKGTTEHASGIESYTLTVNEVADGLSTSKIFDVTLNKTETSTTLNLTSADGKPKLYSILLEVKDAADNVQQTRRFVLFDETTNISIDSLHNLNVTSASTETKYIWQTHHNDVCLDWRDYFYNRFYKDNSVLGKIKADDGINGIYEQQIGVLPVSGTPNVHGITSFTFSWSVDNGTLSSEILVPNFLYQTYCHSLPLKDGQTYILNIRATDIVNNTYLDNRTIHIDRSVPHINNIGLEKNGVRRLFAHGNTDLAKMSITFEVMDQHSGIQNVKWVFGTADFGGILGTGMVSPDTMTDRCPANVTQCYCPDVGSCEKYKYSVSLNKLISNGTNEGKHNRPYYFTIKATNNAKLINVEHLDILVDDSPPVKGVVLEGTIGSKDIDFTSEDEVMINWHGFIDHESGIKEYRLAFSDACLNKEDLFKEDGSVDESNYTAVPFTESSVRLVANFTGRKYTSIVAINNALEASDVACSDGIIRDNSPPSINNLKLHQGRWSESLYCKDGIAWLFSSDLKKSILPSSRLCSKTCQLNSPESDMFDVLPTEPSLINDSDIFDFHCLKLPRFDIRNTIYLPNNHLSLLWSTENVGSKIDDFYVGIGEGISSKATIMDFKATHMNTRFKINHLGVGSVQTFYVYIKSVNKANIERTTVVGPILIDETPPVIRSLPAVKIGEDWVTVGWENDTFYDNEQTEAIDQIFFEIVQDGTVMSPLLEWRTLDSTSCPDYSGGCFKYPLKRMQKMDTDLGLNFTFNVHVFNHAGHFTKATTETFKLPSRYPPGQAVVLDIDPEIVNGINKDTNIQFSSQRMCASWTGLRHHEKVNLMIGIGTTSVDANVVNFTMLNDTSSFECIVSSKIALQTRYFFLVKANCSGGTTISASNGVELYNKSDIISSFDISSALENVPIRLIGIDLHKHTSSVGKFCLTETVLTGPLYTMVVYNVNRNSSIKSDDVHIQDMNLKSNSSELTATFIALTELPCFIINSKNAQINVTIDKMSFSSGRVIIKEDRIYGRWTLSHMNLISMIRFELALFQVGDILCNYTDSIILPYELSTNMTWHSFKSFNSKTNSSHYAILKACTHVRCINVSKSLIYTFENEIEDALIANPTISSNIGGCSSVNFSWAEYEAKSGISIYLWTISRDKNANNILIGWQQSPLSRQTTYSVNECIGLPSLGLGTMFVCVKGLSKAGNVATRCEMAKVESNSNINSEILYDIDTKHISWAGIKEMMNSLSLGEKDAIIHDAELDFGTSNTKIAGVLFYATERNVIWYLMNSRRLPLFDKCEHDSECLHTITNSHGYAVFDSKFIQTNVHHYICAYSSEAHIDREAFVETLKEIRLCSNGFIIDTITPSVGTVTVKNNNGFIHENYIDIRWSGFTDNIDVGKLGYNNRLKYYSVAIGTRIGGEDLKNFTIVGNTNSITEKRVKAKDGMELFISIKATDQAGLYAIKSTTGFIKDATPPHQGVVSINGRQQGVKIVPQSNFEIDLLGFGDPHSGIDYYEVNIGSSEGSADVMSNKYFETSVEIVLPDELPDGHSYYATVKAYNRAGLPSLPVSHKFILDKSPPTGGHVLDGQHQFKKDLNFQHDLTAIYTHWYGFNDPHSRLLTYKVGLGSQPYIDDTRFLIDVGVEQDHIWKGTFVPGQKYYSTVKACNDAGLCHTRSSNGVILDNSPPIAGVVIVGTDGQHQKYHPDRTSINIQWFGFSDPQSSIDHYETCIGTSPHRCDIKPFTTNMLQSHTIFNHLRLEQSKSYYVTVKAFNRAGMNITSTSDEFKIDDTPPIVIAKPYFVQKDSLWTNNIQYEKSVFHIKWNFEDDESQISSHIVTLKTHHEGHSPIENVQVGDVKELTVTLDDDHWLSNGDTYFVVVNSCNTAGLCTSAKSENILIDSTPPHQGGFKPPMLWHNVLNSNGQQRCNVSLTWYGFFDAESTVDQYYFTVSRTYSEQELSGGIIRQTANINSSDQSTNLVLHDYLMPDDKIILTVWAQNKAGLNSSVARVTANAIPINKGLVTDLNGILEIERHSCDVHFCNGDCTCAVVGKPCIQTSGNASCTEITKSDFNSTNIPDIVVFGGLSNHHSAITGSSACLSGHWNISGDDDIIHRYEWSMGLKGKPYGDGVFSSNEIPWKDIGKLNQVIYCLPQSGIDHDQDYIVYVKAWFSATSYSIFESPPIHTDHSPPKIRRGKKVKDSDATCGRDYDIIDWMDTITACWTGVFSEQQGDITHYSLSLGSTINGSDIFTHTDVELSTSYTLDNISLSHGTKYYFTVTAYNSVGLHTTLSSDGFLVDMDTPIAGVVFNTDRYVDSTFQSSTSSFTLSWHGFTDHHSGIRSYFVAVIDELDTTYTNVSFSDVFLKTNHVFTNLNLQHGQSYVGLVKAIDAAGHVSEIVKSRPKMVDTTPPFVSSCERKLIRFSNEFTDTNASVYLNMTMNTFYMIDGFLNDLHLRVAPSLSVNGLKMILPILENNNGSAEFQFHFLVTDDYDEDNVTLSIDDSISAFQKTFMHINISECKSSNDFGSKLSDVEVKQMGLSKLKITALVSDNESSISKIEVAVGTTPGSSQLYILSPMPHNGIIDVDLVHDANVYVTVIAYNNANLKSTFHSSPLLIDKTPPVITNITTTLREEINSTGNVDIDVKWNVEDNESNVKYCLCGLGTVTYVTDIEPYDMSDSINSCQFADLSLRHGEDVYVSVKCVNSIELSSVPIFKKVPLILQPPMIDSAKLRIISASNVLTRENVSSSNEPSASSHVLSNASSVLMEWSDFFDETGIDHYEYSLKLDNETIIDWQRCYQTTAEIHGSYLMKDKHYTAKVRAINNGLFESRPIEADMFVHDQPPQLSGEPLVLKVQDQQLNMDWSSVFNLIDEIGSTFDVTIGTRPGFTDIIELNRVMFDKYMFDVPTSTVVTPDVRELFITITCTYLTGANSLYKSNYKM